LAGISGISEVAISSCRTVWLTLKESNFHIPFSKMPFEMSGFFPLFWGKLGSGDLIPTKLHMQAGQLLGTDHL
jgi:hypothetical protein